jgi:hypothetical protein
MNTQAVTALTISGCLAFGMVLALLGRFKLALADRPEQVTGRVDLLLSLLNALLIPMMFGAGLLVDTIRPDRTMVLGSVVLALAFLALSAGPAYLRCVLSVIAAAFGAAAVGVATVVLMPRGLFGDFETTASLQFGLVLVSLGALLTPPLIDVLLRCVGFGRSMAVVALLMLAPALLAWRAWGALAESPPPIPLSALFEDAGVWMAGLVFFCYAPLEGFLSVWTTALLTQLRQPERQVRWLAGFWSAVVVSRLAVALVEHAGYLGDAWSGWFLVGSAVLAAVVLGNLAGAVHARYVGSGLVLLGCCLGPIFPLLVGMLFHRPAALQWQGSAFGLLYACGSLGSLALAPLVASSARAQTLMRALQVPLALAGLLAAAVLLFVLLTKPAGW